MLKTSEHFLPDEFFQDKKNRTTFLQDDPVRHPAYQAECDLNLLPHSVLKKLSVMSIKIINKNGAGVNLTDDRYQLRISIAVGNLCDYIKFCYCLSPNSRLHDCPFSLTMTSSSRIIITWYPSTDSPSCTIRPLITAMRLAASSDQARA